MWLPPLYDTSPDGDWNYRRRARLAVKDVAGKGRVLVGFRERHAPFVTDMHRCDVLATPVDSLIDPLSEMLALLSIRSRLPQIEVAVADNATALVFRVLDPPNDADRNQLSEFARQHGVQVLLQPGGMDSIIPLDTDAVPEPLYYGLPAFDVRIQFEPTDFVQINAAVNKLMVQKAIELLQINSESRVLDLYCGIGNFTLPIARQSAYVRGLEGEQRQVSRAEANATLNDIGNCDFHVADLAALTGKENWLKEDWTACCWIPPGAARRSWSSRLARCGPGESFMCPAIPAPWLAMPATWSTAMGITLKLRELLTCSHIPAMSSRLRYFRKNNKNNKLSKL